MSTHHLRLVSALAVVAALAGCGVATGDDPPAGDGDRGIGGDYVSDGGPNPPFRDGSPPIRLTLGDGEIAFTASCNHFSAQATWNDGVLRTGALGGTEMGCPGALQKQDEWMIDFFGSSPTLELDGTDLVVRSDEARVWFVPADELPSDEPGDAGDLVDTRWRLTGIAERDGDSTGMMVIPDDVAATIRFEDGEFTADTGCNTGSGPAVVEGEAIRFGDFPITLLPCRGAAAEVERGVLRVLAGTVTWSISGDELRLVTRDGRHELVYQR